MTKRRVIVLVHESDDEEERQKVDEDITYLAQNYNHKLFIDQVVEI